MGLFQFKLPDIGEGMHEGEIVKWHVKPGDPVEEDQVILEVQNDKAVVELPSPVNGTVKEIKVSEGTVAVVGDVLITFEVEGEVAGQEEASPAEKPVIGSDSFKEEHTQLRDHAATGGAAHHVEHAPSPSEPKANTAVSGVTNAPAGEQSTVAGGVLATPSIRKFAREQGVQIGLVKGTGRHGQVTRENIVAYAAGGKDAAQQNASKAVTATESVVTAVKEVEKAATPAAGAVATGTRVEERMPLRGVRKIIAAAMTKSVYTAPHVTVMDEVDVTKLVEFRERHKPMMEKKGVKLTYLPFIVKALVGAVRQFPVLNASIDDDKQEIVYKKYYNIGIATDTDNGLIVPVVEDADRKNMWTIAEQIKDLAARGREGKLAASEMRGSTISISNIGSAGGMFFTPVINWPEVAILGVGRITEKPVVRDGELAIGKVLALSLSFDHRLVDGATAQFALNYIKELLESPELLVMEV